MTGLRTTDDYVLGTHAEELERLGLQHRLWRPHALGAWERAGIGPGSTVLDVGAGPGYAAADLGELVGPGGRVVAVERSARFAEAARERCRALALDHVRVLEADLTDWSWEGDSFDAAWCRWVASFVTEPRAMLASIARALRPGAVAVFHEYVDYASWRFAPPRRAHEAFVREVMESWRENGGEPDIALHLPGWLDEVGLPVIAQRPLVFALRRSDPLWKWPVRFVEVNLDRLRTAGRMDAARSDDVRADLRAAEEDPRTLMITPMVLELIARRS